MSQQFTSLSENDFEGIVELLESQPSGEALWLIPILEKWSKVPAATRSAWQFYGLPEQEKGTFFVILNCRDNYGIIIGEKTPAIEEAWELCINKRLHKIFTGKKVLEKLKSNNPDFNEKCRDIRIKLIYRLDPGDLRIKPDGNMRKAKDCDIQLLEDWYRNFDEEEGTFVKRDYNGLIKGGSVYVYEKEGEVLSITRVPFAGSKYAKLAGSYTPPAHRRRGYGTQLQSNVCNLFLEKQISLLSDPEMSNYASIKVKEKLGFKRLGEEVSIYPGWD